MIPAGGIALGPLTGVRLLEFAGIGPAPFCGMLFADLGAQVIRVDRPGAAGMAGSPADILGRGRRSLCLDLKKPAARELVLELVERHDALIEGFRPGVMERLELGPDPCLERNPKLVYGRMTGWGQHGPLARAAGHDINYIALTGALDAIGRREGGPVPPLNLLGDFGGGALYLAFGLCAALLEAQRSGQGQVVDVAITDGVISLLGAIHSFQAAGMWQPGRQNNTLDGGAHFYDTYECADGKWVAVGSIEPGFYRLLAEKLGVDLGPPGYETQFDRSHWPRLKEKVRQAFKTRTRSEWCRRMEGSDVCFAPVLSMEEAASHPHNHARQSLVEHEGVLQSAPAPRFGRTPGKLGRRSPSAGADSVQILHEELGLDHARISELLAQDVVRTAGNS